MNDINNMNSSDFDNWLSQHSSDTLVSDDELLAQLTSQAIMEEVPEKKAQMLVDTANMCMAMVDRILGSQVSVATCLTLTRH